MILTKIRLKNFRSYKEETQITTSQLTALVGANDAGKSTILEALDIFFEGGSIKIDPSDASVDGDPSKVVIACSFSGFPSQLVLDAQANTSLSEEYLLNEIGQLEIVKEYDCSKSRVSCKVFVRALHPSAVGYNDLLQSKNADLKKLIDSKKLKDQCNTASNPSMRRALWSNAPDLQLKEQLVRIDDKEAKAIWEALSLYMPIYALFRSDRSSSTGDAEVQDPMKLAIKRALAEAEGEIQSVKDKVQQKAEEIAIDTVRVLRELQPELKDEYRPIFSSEKWDAVFKLDLEDANGIAINKKGSGLRRLILLSFFRAEVERKLKESAEAGYSRPIIYGVEEPETSQHPANQRILVNAFSDLAASGVQVLLTTHVPALASLLPLDSLRFVRKKTDSTQPEIHEGNEHTFRLIVEALGILPEPLAKKIGGIKLALVVEGPHDHDALMSMSRILRAHGLTAVNLDDPCESIFKVLGGGGDLQHWVNRGYVNTLGIPQVHIYDSDKKSPTDAVKKETASRAEKVNAQENCVCFVTRRRSMDNYLHPNVVKRLSNGTIELSFGTSEPIEYVNMPQVVKEQLIRQLKDGTAGVRIQATTLAGEDMKLHDEKAVIAQFLLRHSTPEELLEMGSYADAGGELGNEIVEWFQAIQRHVTA